MLVLTHKVGQAIFIGNPRDGAAPIEITVEEVRGDNVRLTSAHSIAIRFTAVFIRLTAVFIRLTAVFLETETQPRTSTSRGYPR